MKDSSWPRRGYIMVALAIAVCFTFALAFLPLRALILAYAAVFCFGWIWALSHRTCQVRPEERRPSDPRDEILKRFR